MGTDVIVEGFRKSTDPKWGQMRAITLACDKAGIEWPRGVSDFFGDADPSCGGKAVDIDSAIKAHSHPEEGYPIWDVDITKLPKDLKIIRVWLSY